MTPENFVYFLQGFAEVHGECPTQEQWNNIKSHLKLVFDKRTPDYNKSSLAKHMETVLDKTTEWPAWQQQLLKDRINTINTPPTITC